MKCYFFGTFNPIHIGHKKIVDEVKKYLNAPVTVVPSYSPPHKNTLDFSHRINMARLVFGEDYVSDIEEKIMPPNYSYKTIEKLGECYFIIGYDAFLEIESWKNPKYLKNNLHFIVIPRDFQNKNDKRFDELRKKGYDFTILDFNLVNISSSEIREKIKRGEDTKNLLPKSVESYIYEHNLYK